jgi:hypothetical protein
MQHSILASISAVVLLAILTYAIFTKTKHR